jgi:hypothetical protein
MSLRSGRILYLEGIREGEHIAVFLFWFHMLVWLGVDCSGEHGQEPGVLLQKARGACRLFFRGGALDGGAGRQAHLHHARQGINKNEMRENQGEAVCCRCSNVCFFQMVSRHAKNWAGALRVSMP